MAGRPSKFTPAAAAHIVQAVRDGNPLVVAAVHGGISYRTLDRWMLQGKEQTSGRFVTFVLDIARAEADAILTRVARISRAAEGGQVLSRTTTTNERTGVTTVHETYSKGEWAADAWLLERRFPAFFGRRDRWDILTERLKLFAEESGISEEELLTGVLSLGIEQKELPAP
ncbi:hypothetical protein LCGC14_0313060 [marine sediment metagenome]|uniref:Uncharacterized protein n=1 Tax=marine sediment metagenome TaxID=412755 RepID=A0A0F9TRT1_9ZZZZ